MEYNNSKYYYVKNAQGDIIGLLDSNLNQVASYTYDSWGKCISVKDNAGNIITDMNHIANKNPYRYRSYRYDSETGMYYLQSRYYNPEWGRFINADIGLSNTLIGKNLYVYCDNNPINYYDPYGNVGLLTLGLGLFGQAAVITLGIGGIIVGAVSAFSLGYWIGEQIVNAMSKPSSQPSSKSSNNKTTVTTASASPNGNNRNDKSFNDRLDSKTQTTTKSTNNYSQVSDFKYSNSVVQKHTIIERPYMNSSQLIRELVNSSNPVKDLSKNLTNGLKWATKGSFNGTQGIWELVADMDSKTIVHFLFKGGI